MNILGQIRCKEQFYKVIFFFNFVQSMTEVGCFFSNKLKKETYLASHKKETRKLVMSLRGVNYRFGSPLGCSVQNDNITHPPPQDSYYIGLQVKYSRFKF